MVGAWRGRVGAISVDLLDANSRFCAVAGFMLSLNATEHTCNYTVVSMILIIKG